MTCDKPGMLYADDDRLLFGCSACGFDVELGEVALPDEIARVQRRHRSHGNRADPGE